MITGAIALLMLVVVLPAALGNGEIGTVLIAVVIAVLALAIGSACRSESKAYNNFIDYWADGGPDRRW